MSRARPACMPTQARGSRRVLEYDTRGLTANARHPNGMMDIIFGLEASAAGVEIGASQFYNSAYGALCDAVECVHVRRRRSGVYRGENSPALSVCKVPCNHSLLLGTARAE
eukprot:6213935-Pleurochrysis_carterae.AAC.3